MLRSNPILPQIYPLPQSSRGVVQTPLKVISLALFPPFEVYPQVEERLEIYRRVRGVVTSLQDLGEFEL
jgi:hypothetical protein